MEEWKSYNICDLCQSISETYRGNATSVVLINTSDVLDGEILNHERVLNKDLKGQFKKVFHKNDILYSEIRPANKRFAFVEFEPQDYIASTKLMVIRANDMVLPRFLFHYLKSEQTICELQALAESRSGTFPQITFSELGNLEISLPPIETQKRIVRFLDSIENKITLNNRINHNLEEQARNVFLSYIEQDSTECYFSDMITIGSGGTPRTSESRFWNGKIPFFSPKDVSNSCFTLVTEKSITDDGLSNCNSNLYPENTTFITARGTVGKISLAGVPMAMNQSCFALTSRGHVPYFAYFLTERVVESLKKKANGAVFDAINSKDIAQELVSVPKKDVILHIEDMIRPYMDSIKSKSIENLSLIETRDALLLKLMSGKLNINEIDS